MMDAKSIPNAQPGNTIGLLFRDHNFRWLLGSGGISMLGDQFTLIALPWLVLTMTSDTLVLGTVLGAMSIPRALFILIGGALVDRYSPKRVLMLTNYANVLLLGLLALLVLTASLTLWMLYVLALGIGLASAFSLPSTTAIMPRLISDMKNLQTANSVMLGLRQVSLSIGPMLAGLLVALFSAGNARAGTDVRGLGLAFLFDAISFALSAWALTGVSINMQSEVISPAVPQKNSLAAIVDGLRGVWNDDHLRAYFLYMAAVAFFTSGPILIALPVLANTQLSDGAAALGIMLGTHGAGTLIGMILSGLKPNWRIGNLGLTILLIDALIGALLIPLGQMATTWSVSLLLLAIGALGGFLQVMVFTWVQRRIAPELLGRGMSLFMFVFMGIAPLSAAITGWMMRNVTLSWIFSASGLLLIGIALLTFAISSIRTLSDAQPIKVGGKHG